MRERQRKERSALELWDIYDEKGALTGRTVERGGRRLAPGEYHLCVCAVIVNGKGEILCTHRDPAKESAPGMWENSGGSVQLGESSQEAIARELREETGLAPDPGQLRFCYRSKKRDFYMDVYLVFREVDPGELRLQPGETDDARWFPYEEWEQKARAGEILCPSDKGDENFYATLREMIRRRG